MNRSKKHQHRMFQNPILELLSKSGPWMMNTFHLGLISFLLYFGYLQLDSPPLLSVIGVFVLAFLCWTLAEYLLHRYVFHFVREDNKLVKAFHYALPGYHHQKPYDANRLFMPPVPALLILSVFFVIYYLFMGHFAWIFLAGFDLGYLCYANVHYLVHTQKAPAAFKGLWKHHALHHHKYPDKAFGVSSRIWDRIFGTMPPSHSSRSVEVRA